jgi:toxin ParE1/3/4
VSTCRFTTLAAEDLEAIHDYIAIDNPQAALHFVHRLESRCRVVAEMPQLGRLRPELLPNLRSLPLGRYVIYYRPIDGGAEVLRVLHSARDVHRLLKG